jgi:hypothetical protein
MDVAYAIVELNSCVAKGAVKESTSFESRPESVAAHYDNLDRFYRDIWGEHVHHYQALISIECLEHMQDKAAFFQAAGCV